MSDVQAQAKIKYQCLRAVVKRKDGSVENRGIVTFVHPNKFIHIAVNIWVRINGWRWARYERAYFLRVHGIDLRKVNVTRKAVA